MFANEQYVGIASIPALPLLGKAKQLHYATVLPRRKASSIPFWPQCRCGRADGTGRPGGTGMSEYRGCELLEDRYYDLDYVQGSVKVA